MQNFLTKFILITLFCLNANSLGVEERIADEKLEKRAQELFLEVRCIVCQGQVIESSNAEFSYEMRKHIRKQIISGNTNQQIKDDLIKEFGNDILLNPNLEKEYLLWLLPLIIASIGLFLLYFSFKRTK